MSAAAPPPVAACPLCESDGGHLVFSGERFRVIRADEAGFPAFYRVVWTEHAREFTDLPTADRALCMEVVAQVESSMRAHLRPHKINLAALGNAVPHLHWHVIARFDWDSHFPAPVWAQALRPVDDGRIEQLKALLAAFEKALCEALAIQPGNRTAL